MKITVVIIGSLIDTLGFSEKQLILPDNFRLKDLLRKFSLEDYRKKRKMILRNGKPIKDEELLKDGDRIVISHIYSGG